jgi:hypothetical protein
VQGILFAAGAIATVVATALMLESWRSWTEQSFIPLHTRVWAWGGIAFLPLFFALFRVGKSIVPVTVAVVYAMVLPWCNRTWTEMTDFGTYRRPTVQNEPSLLAYVVVAAFAVFVIWWGVRQVSKALVNLGIVGFAIVVFWFYCSDIFDKVGRSLGLIGMGVLFLAGGWALEKMRRSLLGHMTQEAVPSEEAQ